jgi:precorrin-2 methylase
MCPVGMLVMNRQFIPGITSFFASASGNVMVLNIEESYGGS